MSETVLQQALKAYVNAVRSAGYWKSMFDEAQRARDQRQGDLAVAQEKCEAALNDLIRAAHEVK